MTSNKNIIEDLKADIKTLDKCIKNNKLKDKPDINKVVLKSFKELANLLKN